MIAMSYVPFPDIDTDDEEKLYKAYFDFSGGQNDTSAPDNLRENELVHAENFDIVLRGGLQSRNGTVEVPFFLEPATNRIDRQIEFELPDGTLKHLVLTGGNLYDKADVSTPILTDIGAHLDYVVFNDKLYFLANGEYYVYTGSGTPAVVTNDETDSKLSEVKKCRYIAKHGDRVFMTGNPDSPFTLYYSQIINPTYFKSGQYIVNALTDDGDVNTGLKDFHGALLVFKTRSIHAWFGYDIESDVEFVRLSVHTGTKAYRTIQHVGNYLMYLGEDGVYALRGIEQNIISTIKISNNQNNTFKTVRHTKPYYLNTPCAVFKDGKYMLSFASNAATPTVNDTIAVFFNEAWNENAGNEPWTFYRGLNVSSFLNSMDGNIYMGSSNSNKLFRFDEAALDDMGVAIHYKLVTKAYSADAPIHRKKFRRGWVILRQFVEIETRFDLTPQVDYVSQEVIGDESLVYGEGEWGEAIWGWSDTVTRMFKINKKGKRIQFILEAERLNNKILLYGIAIEYKVKQPEKGA
jgi:hypothetical protein